MVDLSPFPGNRWCVNEKKKKEGIRWREAPLTCQRRTEHDSGPSRSDSGLCEPAAEAHRGAHPSAVVLSVDTRIGARTGELDRAVGRGLQQATLAVTYAGQTGVRLAGLDDGMDIAQGQWYWHIIILSNAHKESKTTM